MEDISEEYITTRYAEDEWQLLDSQKEDPVEYHVEPGDISSQQHLEIDELQYQHFEIPLTEELVREQYYIQINVRIGKIIGGDTMRNQDRMRFEDSRGKAWYSDELNELTALEIEEMGLHVAEV